MRDGALARIGALVSAAWCGEMLAVGTIAAPALFATLSRTEAGAVATRLFATDATVAVLVGALVCIVALQLARQRAERGVGSRMSADLLLALASIGSVVLGYYAIQPMLGPARAGDGPLSFGALHAVSAAFFALRFMLVATLAWRFSRPATGPATTS